MRSRILAMVILVAGMLVPTTAAGQTSDPVPYVEYRAAVDAYAEAEAAFQAEGGALASVADALAKVDALLVRQEAEGQRLAGIVPEPCYADAHAAFLSFWRYRISSYADARPLMAAADTVMGMIPALLAVDALARAAHPLAYVEDDANMTGFRVMPTNILDTLATCAPMPGASPGPSAAAASQSPAASAPSEGVVFTAAGLGTTNSAPFELAPGDYRLAYSVRTGVASSCGVEFALASTDRSYSFRIGGNGAWVYADAPYANETWFSVPAAGRYYLGVGGDCEWEVRLDAVASPNVGLPITVAGSGLGSSPAFSLQAGDYVVRYTVSSPTSDGDCSFSARGLVDPVSPSRILGGEARLAIAADADAQGETYVYALPAGRYTYLVDSAWCQYGLAEPVAWEVTIDAQ